MAAGLNAPFFTSDSEEAIASWVKYIKGRGHNVRIGRA
jgi:hypothetical protein